MHPSPGLVLAVATALLAVAGAGAGDGRSFDGMPLQSLAGSRSPAGRIAFSAGAHPQEDVYVVHVDGSGLRRLTSDPGADFDPSWSPDGRRIAYRHETPSGGDESAEIYVMEADGSNTRNLTSRAGQDHAPAWSPNGKRIAFASVRGGSLPRIWVMNADGSRQRRVSRVWGEYPSWSPDGRRIAFERNTFGRTGWDIWIVKADGSNDRPLVAWRSNEQGAAWSPNGKWIVFDSDRGSVRGDRHLWVVRADGSHARRLTRRRAERPAWSPGGAYVLFTAGRLFIVRRDGSAARSVPVDVPGELALADWAR